MSQVPYISADEIESKLTWTGIRQAMIQGHKLSHADIDDILFKHDRNGLLNRAAWIKELGIGVKTATIFPGNADLSPPVATINAVCTLFDPKTGVPSAIVDGNLVTKYKTAGDSILGAYLLARPDSKTLLIVGAGTVATSLIDAYAEIFPNLETILIWNRTLAKAEKLAADTDKGSIQIRAIADLAEGCALADIISSATMTTSPVLKGDWIKPGTHVDLIGAYTPDMREADDELMKKADIYVDARETTVHDIGELIIPIKNGVISENDVLADLYDLCNGAEGRKSDTAITLYKNGGGAHLDLMTANYIKDAFTQNT